MSDMGDDFHALKRFKQEKRADNREASAEMLKAAGIAFKSKNIDAHLIVQAGSKVVDFWPGTGLWIVRGISRKGRGVRSLIAFVTQDKEAAKD